MKSVRQFFGWFFLSVGVVGFFQQPIAGLVFLTWAVLLLPFINQLLERKGLSLELWKKLIIVVIGLVLINLTTPRSQSSQVIQQAPTNLHPLASDSNKVARSNSNIEILLPKKEISLEAVVQKKGLDFSFETVGKVRRNDKAIILNYVRSWQCGTEAPESIARQEWQTVFDLASKTWTDRVKELNNCLGNANQEWINYSTVPSQFKVELNGNKTVIRADSQDSDGSIIVADSLVVQYELEDAPLSTSISPQVSQSVSNSSSTPHLPREGVLVAEDSEAQVNVRTGAGTNFESHHYGVVGDTVIIMGSAQDDNGSTWYQIKFPVSGADGWVRDDFIKVRE